MEGPRTKWGGPGARPARRAARVTRPLEPTGGARRPAAPEDPGGRAPYEPNGAGRSRAVVTPEGPPPKSNPPGEQRPPRRGAQVVPEPLPLVQAISYAFLRSLTFRPSPGTLAAVRNA